MIRLWLSTLLMIAGIAQAQSPQGYYRFPTLHEDKVVFVAEGDLWTVNVDGGIAQRLTSHPEEETHPRISPDGKTLAFTACYEGPTEVYTMPLTGGLPTRRTYEAEPSYAIGWTPDARVLYSTSHYATLPDSQLVALDLQTGRSHRLPLSQASDGTYDAEGVTFYFARPRPQSSKTKRYQGGTARNIWRFGEGDEEAVNLTTDHPGENHSPMWWNGHVYFVCDRDGTMNIWSMDADGGDLRQYTNHVGWDVVSDFEIKPAQTR